MNTRKRIGTLIAYWGWLGVVASVAGDGAGLPADVYNRGGTEFAQACFSKPAETNAESLTFKLAPLFVQETGTGTNQSECRSGFGALIFGGPQVTVDARRPTVYVEADTVQVLGKAHTRLTYLWFCPAESVSGTRGGFAAQGVRITLSSEGYPAVWEVLNDRTGRRVVFVSQNLESAAAAQFGATLKGRRYMVEGPTGEGEQATVVARVIDDGPVPMGPIVYVRTGKTDIETLVCRCMPAQVKKLTGTENYQLEVWSQQLRAKPAAATFWPGKPEEALSSLRLPKTF